MTVRFMPPPEHQTQPELLQRNINRLTLKE
jgi:hypothetical protein